MYFGYVVGAWEDAHTGIVEADSEDSAKNIVSKRLGYQAEYVSLIPISLDEEGFMLISYGDQIARPKGMIGVFVVIINKEPRGQIRPIDYPHGRFEANKNEPLMEFLKRTGLPIEGANRFTLPEWGITSTDLSRKVKEYGIRNGDAVYIMCF